MTTLSLDQVSVSYGDRHAVGPVSLEARAGTWTTLIGPNGAGKTSLIHAVAGLVHLQGSVLIDGQNLGELSPRRRAAFVALVPQRPLIPNDMSVMDYALLGRTPHIPMFGIESARDREIVAAVLARLELSSFAARRLGELSGGELQRVLLARALAQQAPVLLLDEPTTALDLGHQQQALRIIDELRLDLGLTVVSTMHDLTLAAAHTDTMMLLHDGIPVATGPPTDVLTEATLRRYYQADIQILVADDGTIAVVPLSSKAAVI